MEDVSSKEMGVTIQKQPSILTIAFRAYSSSKLTSIFKHSKVTIINIDLRVYFIIKTKK